MKKGISIMVLCGLLLMGLGSGAMGALPLSPINPGIPNITLASDISGDFTDPNFRKAVWEWLGNTGTPGVFTKQDIANRLPEKNYELHVLNGNIRSLAGLQHFEGLRTLHCDNNRLTSLPALPGSLEVLSCADNQLSTLPNLPGSLRDLQCDDNPLTRLPSLPSGLVRLSCRNTQLTSLPGLPAGLRYLHCSGNILTGLPNLPNSLTTLDCSYNYLYVFGSSLGSLIENHPAANKTYTPQYRLKYTGSDIQLAKQETKQLTSSDLKIQMGSDIGIWGDVKNADISSLTFYSSDNAVAKVDSTGVITGQGSGTCSIFALLGGIDSPLTKTEIKVTVSDLAAVITNDPAAEPFTEPAPQGSAPSSDSSIPSVPTAQLKILMTIDSPTAFINDKGKRMDVPPMIINNRTMVPFRFIGEAFGAQVEWFGETRTVLVRLDDKEVRLVIGQTGPGLDVPAQIVNDRTMVPLRYISESLGADVQWFPESRSVEIKR